MQSAKVAASALLEGPMSAFAVSFGFFLYRACRCTPSRISGRVAHTLPCFCHAFCSIGQLSRASLQFRAEPPCRRRVPFTQLQPMRCARVVPIIVRYPAEVFRVFNRSELCFFED